MRQKPSLVIGPMDPLPHPLLPPGSGTHRLSELIARLEQLAQRLQNFQHRYGTQLSHADQEWLYQAQQQVAFDLAALAQIEYTRAVAPEAPDPLPEVEPLELWARSIIQLAQALTQMAQTLPVPRQETRRRGRATRAGQVLRSTARSDGAAVYALLLVLGSQAPLDAQAEARAGTARGPTHGHRRPLAHHGAGTTDDQTHHHRKGTSRPFVPAYEAHLRPPHADPGIRVGRDHAMTLEEQLERVGRLRRRIEGSSRRRECPQ
jgi:hypothetical protein